MTAKQARRISLNKGCSDTDTLQLVYSSIKLAAKKGNLSLIWEEELPLRIEIELSHDGFKVGKTKSGLPIIDWT